MTNIDKLIEAVEYAEENDIDWWDVLESEADAKKAIRSALKGNPDEYQIARLLSISDENLFEEHTPYEAYILTLKHMRKELESVR